MQTNLFKEVHARQLENYNRFYSDLLVIMAFSCSPLIWQEDFYETTTENDFHFDSYFKNIPSVIWNSSGKFPQQWKSEKCHGKK